MRALAALALMATVASVAVAAPFVKLLEDFQGDHTGWNSDVVQTTGGPEGARCGKWTTDPEKELQATALRFGHTGLEMSQWDRLIFQYKFEKAGADWWGIKIVDHPLGDGMQATWKIAGPAELRPGQWQTAVIDVQNPTWLWGERPDRNSQTIHFRCQFKKGQAAPVYLANFRLERDPVRIDGVEPGPTSRDGDALRRVYEITVTNATDAPATVELNHRNATPGLAISIEPAATTIPPGGSAKVAATLELSLDGANAPAPLERTSAEFVAMLTNSDGPGKTTEMSLTVPLTDVPHPSLLITREQATEILARIQTDEKAKAVYDALKRRADDWLKRTPEYPDRGGQWWHWYTCKACGGRLETRSDTEHVCADCGASYSGWPWDDVILDRKHNALAGAIQELGLMYVFTGNADYASKAREILLGYADRYLNYPLHDINGEPKRGGGHVGPQTLDESTWLIPLVQGFDCIYDALSPEDIATIADKMLIPAAELIHDHQWGIHNICCWHASAYGLVGITLADERFAGDAINGPKGFRQQIAQGVTDDGFWYESAWGYHFYTMMALQPLAIASRNIGIDVYDDRYKSMYDAPLRFMAPAGILPAFNDSGRSNALGGGNRYEVSYAAWKDPRHLLPIMNYNRNSLETLLFGVELGEPEEFTLQSTLFPAAGYAVLRSGDVTDHIPENYVCLDYGPHGGGHGHPDKLGFVLYGSGQLLAEDPGCIAYGNPAHGGWYRQTISHSTVVINGVSQKPCTGTLQFHAYGDDIAMASARADEAYDGARMRRTVALVGDRVIDIFACDADEDATFDWAYHNRGALNCGVELAVMDEALPGQGYEWAKEWKYGGTDADWSAAWRQDGGPGVAMVQAGQEGRQVYAAIGMGNPPKIKVPFVVSRSRGKQALYCSALQVFDGEDAPELTIRVLSADWSVQGEGGPEPAVALEITGSGTRDILLVNPAGGRMQAGEIALEGEGALLRYQDGRLASILAVGDAKLSVAGETVDTD